MRRPGIARLVGALLATYALTHDGAFGQRPVPVPEVFPEEFLDDEATDAISDAGGTGRLESDPEFRMYVELVNPRTMDIWDRFKYRDEPLSVSEAEELVDQLFFDWQYGWANYRYQWYMLDGIADAAANPHLSPEAAEVLRAGVLEYYTGGGGVASPYLQEQLAKTLARVARGDDPETLALARSLHDDTIRWAQELGKKRLAQSCIEKRVELFGPDRQELGGPEDDPLRSAADTVPDTYRQARRLAYRLVQDSHLDPARVEELARLAGSDLGNDSLNDDLLARLLATYERILLRKRGVNRRVVLTIDRELLRLARDTDRIHGEKLWRLWSWATAALGKRASDEMRKYVDRELGRVKVEFVRAALWRAARAIFPKQTQAPAAGRSPTTAPATMPASAG